MSDPIEDMVAAALDATGLFYLRGQKTGEPDFILPGLNLEIECKQFYSERAVRQLDGKENIILIQGRAAASGFMSLLHAAQAYRNAMKEQTDD